MLAVRSYVRHPTARTSRQLSCNGWQNQEVFPVNNPLYAVSNTQFPTLGTSGMVTLVKISAGKWIYVSLRTKIPIF